MGRLDKLLVMGDNLEKRVEKRGWGKNMIQRMDVKNNIYPHTQAKLDLYRSYLQNYLRVLLNATFCSKINLYDIFCGAGIYDDGKKGSPIITLDCINDIYKEPLNQKLCIKNIVLTLNDNDSRRIENVKKIASKYQIENCTVKYFNEDADRMLEIVTAQTAENPRDHRNLVFIDPYGYSSINKEKILNVLQNRCTEIILFLPIMQIYRFRNTAMCENESNSNKLRDFVMSFSNHNSIVNSGTVLDFIDAIKEGFTINGKYYACSHYIKRKNGNYYAIFFITSNIYGLEKMVEAKWKLDPYGGEGFDHPSNMHSLFEEEFIEQDKMEKISFLEKILIETIKKSNKISNIDVYKLALINEFLPKHAKSALNNLIRDNKIKTVMKTRGFGISYKNYNDKNVISEFKICE